MKEKGFHIKWIIFALAVIICGQISGHARAESYKDPTVVLEVSCGDTYKYGDMIEVKVLVDNADSYKTYGEGTFKATAKSYKIKAGATGVTWHYTAKNGYEIPKGPEDFDLEVTITMEILPLKVEIAGKSETVAHCAVVYTALISGGVPPYSKAWAPKLTGSFKSAGEVTLVCAVSDAARQQATAKYNVIVHEFGCEVESASTEEIEDNSDKVRLTHNVFGYGPPPGKEINVSVSTTKNKSASVKVSISGGIEAVKAALGYSHGESFSTAATASYPVQLSEGQYAYIYAYPVYEVTTGEVVCRNCEKIYEAGAYAGKKPSHFNIYLEIGKK